MDSSNDHKVGAVGPVLVLPLRQSPPKDEYIDELVEKLQPPNSSLNTDIPSDKVEPPTSESSQVERNVSDSEYKFREYSTVKEEPIDHENSIIDENLYHNPAAIKEWAEATVFFPETPFGRELFGKYAKHAIPFTDLSDSDEPAAEETVVVAKPAVENPTVKKENVKPAVVEEVVLDEIVVKGDAASTVLTEEFDADDEMDIDTAIQAAPSPSKTPPGRPRDGFRYRRGQVERTRAQTYRAYRDVPYMKTKAAKRSDPFQHFQLKGYPK